MYPLLLLLLLLRFHLKGLCEKANIKISAKSENASIISLIYKLKSKRHIMHDLHLSMNATEFELDWIRMYQEDTTYSVTFLTPLWPWIRSTSKSPKLLWFERMKLTGGYHHVKFKNLSQSCSRQVRPNVCRFCHRQPHKKSPQYQLAQLHSSLSNRSKETETHRKQTHVHTGSETSSVGYAIKAANRL